MKTVTFDLYGEVCCDDCREIIHNHFDCPACGKKYAGTSWYFDPYYGNLETELSCENCDAVFELVEKPEYEDWKWIQISP